MSYKNGLSGDHNSGSGILISTGDVVFPSAEAISPFESKTLICRAAGWLLSEE